jgi:hypothetical protein
MEGGFGTFALCRVARESVDPGQRTGYRPQGIDVFVLRQASPFPLRLKSTHEHALAEVVDDHKFAFLFINL